MSEILKYPLDLTGTAETNKVYDEPHTLVTRKNRIFVPDYGLFYTAGMVVKDAATGRELTPNVDYVAAQLIQKLTIRTGKEVCAYVVVINPDVSNNVTLTAQMVGGFYQLAVDSLNDLIDTLQLDDRPVQWAEILGKPVLFPPSSHFHDIGDVYGFEYMVLALSDIRDAILVGDQSQWDNLNDKISALRALINNNTSAADAAAALAAIDAHIADKDNPHDLTAAQINAFTKDEVNALLLALKQLLELSINTHVADKNNPHGVTTEQLNAYNKQQVDQLFTNLADTLNSVKVSIQASIDGLTTTLQEHITDKDNPHNVTAAQVGSYTTEQVDNLLSQAINEKEDELNVIRSQVAAIDLSKYALASVAPTIYEGRTGYGDTSSWYELYIDSNRYGLKQITNVCSNCSDCNTCGSTN